jgi:hypothetical protein
MVRPGRKAKGEKGQMKKNWKSWAVKIAVVVVGIIIANEIIPLYNKARNAVTSKLKKGGE